MSRLVLDSFRNGSHKSKNGLAIRHLFRPSKDILMAVAAVATLLLRRIRNLLPWFQTNSKSVSESGKEDPLDRVRLLRHLPLRLACLVLGTYLFVGVLAYKCVFREATWSVLDALYFSSACLSTIGYGDLVPSTTGGKVFAALFGMSGILVWSSAVATVGAQLVRSETARAKQAFGALRGNALMDQYDKQNADRATSAKNGEGLADTKDDDSSSSLTPRCQRRHQRKRNNERSQWKLLARTLAKPLLLIITGGIIIGRFEGWSLGDSVYFSLVTATTIGFGDYCPTTQHGKLATVAFIPLLLAAAGDIFANLGFFVVRSQTRRLFASPRDRAEWLTPEQAAAMDINRDGRVSRPEFVLYMLLETGAISQDDCTLLEDEFERFDVTRSGYIEEGDLEVMKAVREKPNNASPTTPQIRHRSEERSDINDTN